MEELLKSEHEFSVNTAYKTLYEIEKEERSKVILFKDEEFLKRRLFSFIFTYSINFVFHTKCWLIDKRINWKVDLSLQPQGTNIISITDAPFQ
ncbi:MAG: hypothetical protein ACOX79_04945 [Methanosarcina sp.]|jgi:hypothetical protein